MIEEKYVKVHDRGKNGEYYEKLGYTPDEKGIFTIKVEDLMENSSVDVTCVCDICGKKIKRRYSAYLKAIKKHNGQYYCKECFNFNPEIRAAVLEKTRKTCMEKYGVSNPMKVPEIKEKLAQSCYEKYGVRSPAKIPEIIKKCQDTCEKRYGTRFPICSEEAKKKAEKTMMERYGVKSAFSNKKIKEKAKKTILERYGYEYVFQSPEIRKKIQEKLAANGKVATSKQQIKICEMLNEAGYKCELNYNVGFYCLDCYVKYKGTDIDIEYDGWYWHQDKQKDIIRDRYVRKQGYKILRIKGDHKVPPLEQIIEKMELLSKDRYFEVLETEDYKKIIEKQKGNT